MPLVSSERVTLGPSGHQRMLQYPWPPWHPWFHALWTLVLVARSPAGANNRHAPVPWCPLVRNRGDSWALLPVTVVRQIPETPAALDPLDLPYSPHHGLVVRALLLIDHGSRRTEANEMLQCMAALVQRMAGPSVIVRHAHMELAGPSIEEGVAACIAAGATEIIAFPYMLSPGRHSTSDIPTMVAAAAQAHPTIRVSVTPAFGIEAELGEVILRRAGIDLAISVNTATDCDCWHPEKQVGTCGDACPARHQRAAGASATSGGRARSTAHEVRR